MICNKNKFDKKLTIKGTGILSSFSASDNGTPNLTLKGKSVKIYTYFNYFKIIKTKDN